MGTRSGLGLAERAEARKVMPQAKSLLPATATANTRRGPLANPNAKPSFPPVHETGARSELENTGHPAGRWRRLLPLIQAGSWARLLGMVTLPNGCQLAVEEVALCPD
jgi:hypothetical protein